MLCDGGREGGREGRCHLITSVSSYTNNNTARLRQTLLPTVFTTPSLTGQVGRPEGLERKLSWRTEWATSGQSW